MKTKKFLVLFTTVFAIVVILTSCNSVGIAQDVFTDIEIYRTKDGGQYCVKLNPETHCGMAVDCVTEAPIKQRYTVKELFKKLNIKFKYIEVPGSPCNSFIFDDGIPGDTYYYCSGGYCYAY